MWGRQRRTGMIGDEGFTDSIKASGLNVAKTGRTHDRTPNTAITIQKILAMKEPSTHDKEGIAGLTGWRGTEAGPI